MAKLTSTRRGRPRVPAQVERAVLVHSRRRCCLCVGLQGDYTEKTGQIAHIDHDPSNNTAGNLAFLCFAHHDEYDSVPSQRKGLQRAEVMHYRDSLYDLITRADQPAIVALLQGKNDDERMRVLDRDAIRSRAYKRASDRELLATLVSSAQAWYDDIISRLSITANETIHYAPVSLDFDYVWTRKYLPDVAAATQVLSECPAMAMVVTEAERFLEILTHRGAAAWIDEFETPF